MNNLLLINKIKKKKKLLGSERESSCPCAICKPYIRVKEWIFVVISNVLRLALMGGTERDFTQCEEEKSHMLFLCFIADVGGVH